MTAVASGRELCDLPFTEPGTSFKKTSDTFLQWRDKHTKLSYGFNFSSKADIAKVDIIIIIVVVFIHGMLVGVSIQFLSLPLT